MEYESDSDTNRYRCTRFSHQRTRRIGNKNTRGDHPNDSNVNIGQNTEKNPGDLKRLVVTDAGAKKKKNPKSSKVIIIIILIIIIIIIVDFAVPADYGVNLKKVKRIINTLTLLGNWKNCETWKWYLYQL